MCCICCLASLFTEIYHTEQIIDVYIRRSWCNDSVKYWTRVFSPHLCRTVKSYVPLWTDCIYAAAHGLSLSRLEVETKILTEVEKDAGLLNGEEIKDSCIQVSVERCKYAAGV